tara:strand:+ start:94 stop:258 length:165 start_codon:yes stop_codon:yes gene_type:complete
MEITLSLVSFAVGLISGMYVSSQIEKSIIRNINSVLNDMTKKLTKWKYKNKKDD